MPGPGNSSGALGSGGGAAFGAAFGGDFGGGNGGGDAASQAAPPTGLTGVTGAAVGAMKPIVGWQPAAPQVQRPVGQLVDFMETSQGGQLSGMPFVGWQYWPPQKQCTASVHVSSLWSVQLVLTCLADTLPVAGSQSGKGWQPLCLFEPSLPAKTFVGMKPQKQRSYGHLAAGLAWPVFDLKVSQAALPESGWQYLPPHVHPSVGQVA